MANVLCADVDAVPYFMFAYWIGLTIAIALAIAVLFGIWKKVAIRFECEDERLHPSTNEIIGKIAVTVILLTALFALAGFCYSWVLVATEPNPTPMNPVLQERLDEIQKHEPASEETLAEQKEKIREEQLTKPHQESLNSFEEAMKKEADKIKTREGLETKK